MNFKTIEDKIILELKNAITYVKTVDTYAGQLEDEIKKISVLFPAIYVTYQRSKYEWIDNDNYNESVGFMVFCVAKNLRSESDRIKGSQGCYQMIEDVLSALTNKTLNLNIERIKPLFISFEYISKEIAIYSVEIQTNFDKSY